MLFNNTTKLTKLYFKREWLSATIWLAIIVTLSLFVAGIFTDLYGTSADRIGMAETMRNPAMVAMVGPAYAEGEAYTNGVMYGQMMLLFSAMAVAVMNIFLVIKHTRKDEEEGRNELIRSLPTGRLSNLLGTMIICVIINTILALIMGFGLAIMNIESMTLTGSLLYGASLGVVGICFGAIAALFAQIASTSRGAIAYSFIFLGIDYLTRAIGDVSGNFLSYLTPLGIIFKTETYASNYWWPICVLLGIAVLIGIIAFYLNSHRDLGAGLLASKPGRKEASRFLQSPIGLQVRLLRTMLIGWLITMFILGTSYGSVFGDIEKFLSGSEMMQQIFLNNDKFTFAEQFMTTLMTISSILVAIPTLMIILKILGEEKKGRIENIYAKKVSRNKVLANYLILSIIGSIFFMKAFVLGLWIASSAVMADPISFWTMFGAGLVYLPAIWVIIGIAMLLIAYIPKMTKLVWILLGLCFFVVYIGKILQLPEWLINFTPFGSIPKLPVDDFNISPLIILTIIAVVMFVVGFIGYRKRDLING